MLGRRSPQGELFRPDHLLLEHVGADSFYVFMAREGRTLFRDKDFAGLYREDFGRPGVPPSQLCVLLVLQTLDGVSDEEAIQRTAYDLRWKVALGLELEAKLCAKSTLQLFRAKLVLHERYGELFEKSVQACRKAGLLKRRQLEVAIDTTPVLGRGAVKDTFNLVSDQIRVVIQEVCALKCWEQEALVAEHGLGRHFGSSFKGSVELDWSDEAQRRALVAQLVADAHVTLEIGRTALRGFARNSERAQPVRKACELLGELLQQDIDEKPEDGGGPMIRRGTSRDRIVSTSDPEMRHGHKSHSQGFEGYKSSVVAETRSGVILATDVRGANVPDRENARELVESARAAAGTEVGRVIADTAYGDLKTRAELEATGAEVVAKVPPVTARKGCFSVAAFKIDEHRGVARCPAGKESIRKDRLRDPDGWRYIFSTRDCDACPLRENCTTSSVSARQVTVTSVTKAQAKLRRRSKSDRWRRIYRRRVAVEHRIGRLRQLGIAQARYFGRKKVAFQVALAATVANLVLTVALSRLREQGTQSLEGAYRRLAVVVAHIADRVRRALLASRDSWRPQRATSRPDF